MLPGVAGWAMLLPWLLLVLTLPLMLLRRHRLSSIPPPAGPPDALPLVSVIVPARNEAVNISICVASLLNSTYPRYEIIVVDDGSMDGTGDIVRILADHADGRVRLVDGELLPDGWLGKPWACWQGYQHARGELLLFTDADTRHEESLMGHAVGAVHARGADLVSILPRQLMLTFWEWMILPHIFAILSMRYHDLARVNRTRKPRDVIANGQFIMISRDAYEAVGGHAALRGEVVEDQRLAQSVVAAGRRIFVAHGEDLMETRMYRSLRGIVEGWSKNLALGSRQAAPRWVAPAVPWLIALFLVCVWVVPPLLLAASLFTNVPPTAWRWALMATTLSLLYWLPMLAVMRVPPLYAAGFPVGAAITAWLFVRSALRGTRVIWKGRAYDVGSVAVRPGQPDSTKGHAP
jgi:chlorobactene glucosyltransferase